MFLTIIVPLTYEGQRSSGAEQLDYRGSRRLIA